MYEHEHVSLLSNVAESEGDLPPALNKFRTKLATPLILDLDLDEIGLESIAFNYDWDNLTQDGIISMLDSNKKEVISQYVPAGHYGSVKDIQMALNVAMVALFNISDPEVRNKTPEGFKAPRFYLETNFKSLNLSGTLKYPVVTEVDKMKVGDEVLSVPGIKWLPISLVISPNLRNMIGFSMYPELHIDNTLAEVNGNPIWLGSDIDLNGGVYQVMVYTNLIRHRRVGNHMSQLLRIVQLDRNCRYGDRVSIQFNPIQYFSPRVINATEIEIEIRDDAGELIPFKKGRTTLELDIRRKYLDDGPSFGKHGRYR